MGIGDLSRFVSFFYQLYRDIFDVPTVKIEEFNSVDDVVPQLRTVNPDYPGCSCWVRIRVTNRHPRKAIKDCRAFLIGLEHIDRDGNKTLPIANDRRQLIWNNQTELLPTAQTISPLETRRVDIVATFDDSSPWISFRCYPKVEAKLSGMYIAKVQVSADGHGSDFIQLQITWDGKRYDSIVALQEST